MRTARKSFDKYFETILKFLKLIKLEDDRAWRTAFKLLSFPEIKGTCLGYGSTSISGRGTGPVMSDRLLRTGKEIVELGVDDPDLFLAMGLFEEDFGPDLIGDMFTNIAFQDILNFNSRMIAELGAPAELFEINLRNGNSYTATLIPNTIVSDLENRVPVILLPSDILRDLPVATSWAEVQKVSQTNSQFRGNLNKSVSHLWSKKTLESKQALKDWALSNEDAFSSLLELLHGHDGKPYDFLSDPNGEIIWKRIGEQLAKLHPIAIPNPHLMTEQSAVAIVEKILAQFRHLVEDRDLWREFYADFSYTKPRFEKSAQRIFYMLALSYCDANGLDITPEAETGRGPVDFKFSYGGNKKVLLEIKLSTNKQLLNGYRKQLEIYSKAERTVDAFYVILNVGKLARKDRSLNNLRESQIAKAKPASRIVVIDALPRLSASKVKD